MKSNFFSIFILFFLFTVIKANAQAPFWNWAVTAGGTNSDRANAITYSNDGNLLVAGFFHDTVNFESATVGALEYGMFIAKYNTNGNLIWVKKIAEGNLGIEPQKIFEDSMGNILVSGYFGEINTGGDLSFTNGNSFTSLGGLDIFVSKFTASGNFIWASHIGSLEDDKIASAINESGVFLQGSRLSDLVLENSSNADTLFTNFTWHLWTTKFNMSGQTEYLSDVAVNTSQMIPTGIVADDSNNFYLSGNYYGHPAIGFYPDTTWLSNAGGYTNIYLLKFHYDSTGLVNKWQQYIGGSGNDFSHAMDITDNQEILLTGTYSNSSFFGNDSGSIILNSAITGAENFICNFQSNGNLQFAINSGYSISGAISSSAIIHDDSLIYLCGKYTGAPFFGEGNDTFSLVPIKNFFVAAYTISGTIHWARGSLSSFIDGLNSITLDDSGHVFAVGFYTLYCVIDTGQTDSLYIPSAGVDDIFIGRLGYKILTEDTIIIDTTFISMINNVNSLFVYPNPATDFINIELKSSLTKSTLEIYSLYGRLILSEKLLPNTKKIVLNTTSLYNGTYHIQLKTKSETLIEKFSIIKDK